LVEIGKCCNALFCEEFAAKCGAVVPVVLLISMGSIPAASTIFERRKSSIYLGLAPLYSVPTAIFCMIIALSVAGAGGRTRSSNRSIALAMRASSARP